MDKKNQKFINNLKNTYCRIKSSKINGVGVFAIREIPKNIDPFLGSGLQKWYKIEEKDYKKMDKEIIKMIDDFFVIEEDKSVYVPECGLNGIDISYFLNDSKKPNLKIIGDGKNEAVGFKTLRKIKKGEELSVSYSTFDEKYLK